MKREKTSNSICNQRHSEKERDEHANVDVDGPRSKDSDSATCLINNYMYIWT
jgi:hypothetical protein